MVDLKKKNKDYYEKNKDSLSLYYKKRYEDNKEAINTRNRAWKKENPDKVASIKAKRRANRLNATPEWFEKELVDLVYKRCKTLNEMWGTSFQVDHFIPLQGEDVCGLHCWENLQLLDLSLNCSKHNTNPLK